MSNKLWYDWKEMRRDVNSLCREIVLDKFDPDVIVGLSRGGLTPGVMMSHWMKKPFKPIKQHYVIIQNGKIIFLEKQINEY